jgi:hypothetical protein
VAPGDVYCSRHLSLPVSRAQIALGLLYLTRPAIARLARLIDSPDEEVALKAILALFDRAGFGPGATLHLDAQAPDDLSVLTTEQLVVRTRAVLQRLQAPPTGAQDPEHGDDNG